MMSVDELMSSDPTTESAQPMMSVDELLSSTEPYTVKYGDTISEIAKKMGVDQGKIKGYRSGNPNLIFPGEKLMVDGGQTNPSDVMLGDGTILPMPTQVTQRAGTHNPVEVFSGGVARDTNFRAPMGTPVMLPPGQWKILEAYDKASPIGHPGDSTNQGYGNKITAIDKVTGSKLVYEHLDRVNVKVGDEVMGGQVGTTGSSGNATGPNLGVEYIDSKGRLGDILNSEYAKSIPLSEAQ